MTFSIRKMQTKLSSFRWKWVPQAIEPECDRERGNESIRSFAHRDTHTHTPNRKCIPASKIYCVFIQIYFGHYIKSGIVRRVLLTECVLNQMCWTRLRSEKDEKNVCKYSKRFFFRGGGRERRQQRQKRRRRNSERELCEICVANKCHMSHEVFECIQAITARLWRINEKMCFLEATLPVPPTAKRKKNTKEQTSHIVKEENDEYLTLAMKGIRLKRHTQRERAAETWQKKKRN